MNKLPEISIEYIQVKSSPEEQQQILDDIFEILFNSEVVKGLTITDI